MIVVFLHHRPQSRFQLVDVVTLLRLDNCSPGGVLASLFQRGQDGLRLVARLDHLPLAEIFLGMVERLEDHGLDLLVGQAIAGLHLDLGFLAAALLAR